MARKQHLAAMTDQALDQYKEQLFLEIAALNTEITIREGYAEIKADGIGHVETTPLDALFEAGVYKI